MIRLGSEEVVFKRWEMTEKSCREVKDGMEKIAVSGSIFFERRSKLRKD